MRRDAFFTDVKRLGSTRFILLDAPQVFLCRQTKDRQEFLALFLQLTRT